jgi:3-hydroxybutyryl-CoA dehydrogenase
MIINEAFFAMQEGVAPAREIDTAMKLGTNYPRGPVEWAERIGVSQVVALLSALHQSFGEDRYRVAPLLRKSACARIVL